MTQSELFSIAKKMKKFNISFNPIPACIEKKRPFGKWAGDSYTMEKDFATREKWGNGTCNLGLLVSSDYIVVDVDNKPPAVKGGKHYSLETGLDDFNRLCQLEETLPVTLTANTPSGGKHYYFAFTGKPGETELKNWTACMTLNENLIAVDIRVKGGYVMCSPSKKPTGKYTWATSNEYKVEMAPLPNWILKNILDATKKNNTHFESQRFTKEPLLNFDLDTEDITRFKKSEFWQDCFKISGQPDANNIYRITATKPYDCAVCERRHVKNTNHPFLVKNRNQLRFVCRPGAGNNVVIEPDWIQIWEDFNPVYNDIVRRLDYTDHSIAEVLFQEIKDTVIATAKMEVWMIYEQETGVLREEKRNVIMRPVIEKANKQFEELMRICSTLAKGCVTDETWSQRSATCSKIVQALKTYRCKNDILGSLYELVRDSRNDKKINSHGHLLHCTNGTFNLNTGKFGIGNANEYSTKSTLLPYIPFSEHPIEKQETVRKFFADIMLDDVEMITFLLKVLSSSLNARIKFQFFFFFVGRGSNGKSLLIKLMKKSLGDYYAKIPAAQVTKPNANAQGSTPALMTLLHARAAFLTELEDRTIYTEFLKMLAGADAFSGRNHYEGQVEIPATAKAFIAVNDLPNILDKTKGFWRKLVLINFDASFVENPSENNPKERQLDEDYEDKLLACADTFLSLLVSVHMNEYEKEGIGRKVQPQKVLDAGKAYEYSQNLPLQFYDLTCKVHADSFATTKRVQSAFTDFCKAKAVTKTSELVRHLETLLDERHPPANSRRQVNNKITGMKNVRAWIGFKVDEQRWSLESEDEADD